MECQPNKMKNPIIHDDESLQKMTIITIRALAATAKLSTNGSKAVLIERYLEYMNGENGDTEDNIIIDALMKWTAPVQRDYLKLMHKPTSGTKEALVNRIIGCLPIEKAVEIIKEHRGYLKLQKHQTSSDMEVDSNEVDKEIRIKAAALLVKKRMTERKRKSDTAGVNVDDEDDSSATKKGAHAAPKVPPPQECIWKYQ